MVRDYFFSLKHGLLLFIQQILKNEIYRNWHFQQYKVAGGENKCLFFFFKTIFHRIRLIKNTNKIVHRLLHPAAMTFEHKIDFKCTDK